MYRQSTYSELPPNDEQATSMTESERLGIQAALGIG
jgi:hypothetical protein